MYRNELVSEQSKLAMWESFPYSESEEAYAYGWSIYEMNDQAAYGFSGSLSTMYVTIPESDLIVTYLSNGFANWYSLNNTINDIVTIAMESQN